jgi:peptidylprolyl isomerase
MRRYLLTLPLLLAVFAFAACGDDSSSSSESAAAPTETATEAATEPPTEAPTDAPTSDAPAQGDAGVKVSGKLGAEPKITVPKGGTAPTTLMIKDLKKGTGPKATAGQSVDMQYSGVLFKDGTKFDASWDRGGQPFTFTLGAGMVIPGWDQGIAGMQKGGRRLLIIPPDLGYGAQGSGPIPPNSPLVFVVDLDAIKAP